MTKRLVKVVKMPERTKRLSDMTRAEVAQYASDLIDGGLFNGVTGLSSDEVEERKNRDTTSGEV